MKSNLIIIAAALVLMLSNAFMTTALVNNAKKDCKKQTQGYVVELPTDVDETSTDSTKPEFLIGWLQGDTLKLKLVYTSRPQERLYEVMNMRTLKTEQIGSCDDLKTGQWLVRDGQDTLTVLQQIGTRITTGQVN